MDAQVIVVGAGPVGLLLAGELRLGGAEVIVLDRLAAPTAESRASTLHARTMEIFHCRGLLADLGAPPGEPGGHFAGIPLDFGRLPTPYPGQWKVPQARVERLLADWATGLGADLRRGREVVGLTVTDDVARVRTAAGGAPAGEPGELAGEFVVGCDGGDSTVRRLAGIALPGRDAARTLLRADVAGIEIPGRRFERLPGGLAVAARRPDGVTRVMMSEFGGPAGPRAGVPDFAEVCAVWARLTGEDISGGTPLWVNAFDDANRLAARYRQGRVLLAGDAAHHQLPAGGQAINLGLQDAVNLGWKLAAQVAGHAPHGLLDTYHDERHEVGRRVLAGIDAQARLLLGDHGIDPVRTVLAELLRLPEARARLAATISGLDVRYDGMPRMPLEEFDPTPLRQGRGILLHRTRDPARPPVRGWTGRVEPQCTAGPSGESGAVLIRPDGHIAWTGSAAADPGPALRRWFGHPSGQRHKEITRR